MLVRIYLNHVLNNVYEPIIPMVLNNNESLIYTFIYDEYYYTYRYSECIQFKFNNIIKTYFHASQTTQNNIVTTKTNRFICWLQCRYGVALYDIFIFMHHMRMSCEYMKHDWRLILIIFHWHE